MPRENVIHQNGNEWRQETNEDGRTAFERDPSSVNIVGASTSTSIKPNPKKRTKKSEWSDNEIYALIEIWSNHEVLFHIKHPLYHNKDEKAKALEKIRENLHSKGVIYTSKEIFEKITNLRSYYGAQRRLVMTKKSGMGEDEVVVSKWKFYSLLEFLSDNLIPRNTKSSDSSYAYNIDNPPSKKVEKKIEKNRNDKTLNVMESALDSLQQLQKERGNSNQQKTIAVAEKSEDAIFCELLLKMLEGIPMDMDKELLKLKMQQDVVELRMKKMNTHRNIRRPNLSNNFSFSSAYQRETFPSLASTPQVRGNFQTERQQGPSVNDDQQSYSYSSDSSILSPM